MPDPTDEIDEDDLDSSPSPIDTPVLPTCPGCGYDLSGTLESPEQRCPECGRVWTVDELALQHAARSQEPRSNRVLGVIAPGLTVGGLLLIGLIFGPPITWFTFPVAGILVVLAVAEWARDLHRQSFVRARSRLNRLLYVTGMTTLLLATNVVLIIVVCLALILVITSCGMFSAGLIE